MSDSQSNLQTFRTRIIQVQPPGIEVREVEYIDPNFPSLQKKVHAAEYSVALLDPTSNLDHKIAPLLNSESLLRQRHGKSYDLRPLINDLCLVPEGDNIISSVIHAVKYTKRWYRKTRRGPPGIGHTTRKHPYCAYKLDLQRLT